MKHEPFVINSGCTTGFTAGRPPLLSVLLTVLHLPMVGTCRARKALGVPYAQGR